MMTKPYLYVGPQGRENAKLYRTWVDIITAIKRLLQRGVFGNAAKTAREQLTLIRIFEELRGRGYDGGYDAVRRDARRWSKERGQSTAAAYVPLSFAPGEAYQFDWSQRSSGSMA
jgi:hypothetical protein